MKTLSLFIIALLVQSAAVATTNFWEGATVVSGNSTNGYAKVVWDNGKTYEGYFENHLPNGYGKMFHPKSNDIYFGEFKNGLKDGLIICRGRRNYIGEFKKDERVGSQINITTEGEYSISKHGDVDDLFDPNLEDSILILTLLKDNRVMTNEEFVEYVTTNLTSEVPNTTPTKTK